jgi:hypothetical protein
MSILLKIILAFFTIASSLGGWFLFREFKLFNKNIETSNTSLFERIMVNFFVFLGLSVVLTIIISSLIFMFSNIKIELPF